jgi:rare lipoprotein A
MKHFFKKQLTVGFIAGFIAIGSVAVAGQEKPQVGETVVSKASFYSGYRITANGERFSPNSLTSAHKRLPFGSIVRVENIANGKSVVVRINNRGPYITGRSLDLTPYAFSQIAPLKQGVVRVRYTVISEGEHKYWRQDLQRWVPLNKGSKQKTNKK